MIVRASGWTLLLLALPLLATIDAQSDESYDNNDWIPITPSSPLVEPKKAQGRVLNLDPPTKFFPDPTYLRKQQQQQPQDQFHRETIYQKAPSKAQAPYKFDTIGLATNPNQFYQQQASDYLPQPQQYVQQQQPPNYYNLIPQQDSYTPPEPAPEQKDSVQLLYVPLESLKQQPQQQQPQYYQPVRQEKLVYSPHKQHQIDNIQNDFVKQALAAHKLQQQFQLGQLPTYQPQIVAITTTTSTTTPRPTTKKRKPHQPPLAVYMEKSGHAGVKDVLQVLKNAHSIAVQDSLGPNSPAVFVGPSNLQERDGYTKFPLPYLSSVDGDRIDKKIDDLPFFVAPLSYKTPEGYSKIPLPSPHVGSVVVSTRNELEEVRSTESTFDGQNNALLDKRAPVQAPLSYDNDDGYQRKRPRPTTPRRPSYYEPAATYRSSTPANYNSLLSFTEQQTPSSIYRLSTTEEQPRKEVTYRPELAEEPVLSNAGNSGNIDHQYQFSAPQEYRPANNPLQQYELQQINEFIAQGQPATEPNYQYELTTTQRSAPVKQRTQGTTLKPRHEERPTEKYTVLEEFSISPHVQQNQPSTTSNRFTTTVETIPAKVYKLKNEAVEQEPDLKQHILNQEAMDQEILNSRPQIQPNYYQEQAQQVYRQEQLYQPVEHQDATNPFLPGLINNLQDQAVRPLLSPGLLVPTTEKQVAPTSTTTEHIRITEPARVETTTPKRAQSRGRQRGSAARYSTSTASPPRRTVRTRRPTQKTTVVISTTSGYDDSTRKQQRFRTRGRTSSTERVYTDDASFKQPQLVGGFEASSGHPKSFMQFEHAVDNQQLITVQPQDDKSIKEYHQVYSLGGLSFAEEPMVDIQITHPASSSTTARSQYRHQNEETTTAKPRTRTRIRTRPLTTSTTTPAPKSEDDDFYGFIRQPAYDAKPKEVHFLGEIRPKYTTTTTEVPESETAKLRVRSRPRQPIKQAQVEQAGTRRAPSRNRGTTHFKLPETAKKENDEDDVAGGNYPASYLRAREAPSTDKPNFQITIDPYGGDDQEGQLSIHRPKWVEASVLPPLNDLAMEDKMQVGGSEESFVPTTEEGLTEGTTDGGEGETTTAKKARRRGVWKLVKQRPLDQFVTAESQNYQSVLNSFDEIVKEEATPTTTEGSIFDTLYNIFGMNDKSHEANKTEVNEEESGTTTTTVVPTFPEEYDATTTWTTEENVESTTPELEKISFDGVEPWAMKQQFKTSTSTEISHETEICYKGRCVKSKDEKDNGA